MLFLFVSDKMLHSGNNTLFLNALDGLSRTNTLKHRVSSKAFPIATTLGLSPDRADGRSQPDIHTLSSRFLANGHATLIYQVLVESSTCRYAIREDGNMIGLTNSICGISQAQLRETDPKRRPCISITSPMQEQQ